MITYITHDDIATYVENCVGAHDDPATYDIDAIVSDIEAQWPELINEHDLIDTDMQDRMVAYLDSAIDEDRYWEIVAAHDLS